MGKTELIKMRRDEHLTPNTADVHPSNVDGFLKAGWQIVETKENVTQKTPEPEPAKPEKTSRSRNKR